MAAASKPVSGQPIETTWGGQVHDAVVTRRGVACTAANVATNSGLTPVDLNAVAEGDPTMADLPGNAIVVPFPGLWRIDLEAMGQNVNTGTGGYGVFVRVNAVDIFGGAGAGLGGTSQRFGCSGFRTLAAGDRVDCRVASPGGAAAGTQTVSNIRLTVSLEAQALGSS